MQLDNMQQQQLGEQVVAAAAPARVLGADQQRAVAAVMEGSCILLTGNVLRSQ